MAQKHKTKNPNNAQRTQKDVNRAYGEGFYNGLRDAIDIMVYTLGCDCEMADDWLEFFHERFMKNFECHVHGELSTKDMRDTVYAEKGWEVQIV